MHAVATTNEIALLYSDHADWLRGWLLRRTRCAHRAADLTQDTFCRLLEKQVGQSIRQPRTYLATVARRLLIDDIRRRDIEQAYLDAFAIVSSDAQAPSPERIAEAVDLLQGIVHMLGGLSVKARRAFLMIRFDGMRYAEAGIALGVSERMVKRYVADAYAQCYAFAYAG